LERRDVPATVYNLKWSPPDPPPNVDWNWEIASNWLDITDPTNPHPADHYPGQNGPDQAEDHGIFDGTAKNCGLHVDNVKIYLLDLTATFTGTVYLNKSLTVYGSGGTLAGGDIDVGAWQDGQGVHAGGNLIYSGLSVKVTWGSPPGPGLSGTAFRAGLAAEALRPGALMVQDGATVTVTGGDHIMCASLVVGPTAPNVLPSSVILDQNMTGMVDFASRTTVRVEARGALYFNTNGNEAGTAGGFFAAADNPPPLENYGYIQRSGTGTVEEDFPIVNKSGDSVVRVSTGTLSVPGPGINESVPVLAGGEVTYVILPFSVVQEKGLTLVDDGGALNVADTAGYLMFGGNFLASGPYRTEVDGGFTIINPLDGVPLPPSLTPPTATLQTFTRITGKFRNYYGKVILTPNANGSISQGFEQDGGSTALAANSMLDVTGTADEEGGTFSLGDATGGASLTATDHTQVASGALFAGYGSITGDVTSAGEFDVTTFGGGPGTLGLTGKFTQTAGTSSVAGQDTFAVTGSVDEIAGRFTLGDTSAGSGLSAGSGTGVETAALFCGYGSITGDVTSAGAFEVGLRGVSAATLTLTSRYTQNAGTGTIDAGDTFAVSDPVTENGGTFTLNISNLDAPAGTLINGGIFTGGGSVYGDVTNRSEVDERNTLLSITGDYTQELGTTFIAGNGLTVSRTVAVQGGTFTIAGAVVQAVGGMQIQSCGTLYGNGQVTVGGALRNAGVINLAGGSGPGATPGSLFVTGDYTQTSTGQLDVHLYSNSTYDALHVSGLATLGGTLNVTAMYGYRPGPGAIFSVVTYGSRSGTFAALSLPPVAVGHWDPRYDDPQYPNQLTLWVVY
jgi:hypothetical protein